MNRDERPRRHPTAQTFSNEPSVPTAMWLIQNIIRPRHSGDSSAVVVALTRVAHRLRRSGPEDRHREWDQVLEREVLSCLKTDWLPLGDSLHRIQQMPAEKNYSPRKAHKGYWRSN